MIAPLTSGVCVHMVPLSDPCEDCEILASAPDYAYNEPEHGPCNWNCGSPSCTAPEYPRDEP